MKRRGLVRFQLIALAAVLVLLVYRMVDGSGGPHGLLVLSDLNAHGLRHQAFALDRPARFAVEATGSFEGEAAPGRASLAAYGWILRREDRQVVWQMHPEKAQAGRGSLAHVADTIALEPGTYDVYFASFGNRPDAHEDQGFFRRVTDSRRRWQNESRKWALTLRSADGGVKELRHLYGEDDERAAPGATPLWRTKPVYDGQRVAQLLEVQRPAAVKVYALGEFDGAPKDYGWIEDAVSGDKVWEMTVENTVPAGGAAPNRLFDDEVRLAPGLYRAVFQTDGDHAYEHWRVNPPFDPKGWGLTLAAAPSDQDAVRPFDPWTSRQPVASVLRVRDGQHGLVQFAVDGRLPAVVHGTGEVSGDNPFDYGWIEDQTGKRIWEMSADAAEHAGGADKNRQEMAFLTLEPGTYTLHYQTDDSHAFEDWNSDEPTHPERWGVALFPLQASLTPGAVTVLKEEMQTREGHSEDGHPFPDAPPPPPPPAGALSTGDVMVELVRVGNEAVRQAAFTLREPTRVRIRALGEITPENRSDYGWIQRRDADEVAWEMTWENTRHAGGEERNRLFDGEVKLEPGTYSVHYQTDLWHAYGGFDGQAPEHGENWGIAIWKAD